MNFCGIVQPPRGRLDSELGGDRVGANAGSVRGPLRLPEPRVRERRQLLPAFLAALEAPRQ